MDVRRAKRVSLEAEPVEVVVSLDERDWLPRHCRGEQEAFGELMKAYQAPVYRYLARCGVPPASRDDVFQEIFVKIHLAAASYQPSRPPPWPWSSPCCSPSGSPYSASSTGGPPARAATEFRCDIRAKCCRARSPIKGDTGPPGCLCLYDLFLVTDLPALRWWTTSRLAGDMWYWFDQVARLDGSCRDQLPGIRYAP